MTSVDGVPDVIVDALLWLSVLGERARTMWVYLTIAAIGLAALGGIALIASRPGG